MKPSDTQPPAKRFVRDEARRLASLAESQRAGTPLGKVRKALATKGSCLVVNYEPTHRVGLNYKGFVLTDPSPTPDCAAKLELLGFAREQVKAYVWAGRILTSTQIDLPKALVDSIVQAHRPGAHPVHYGAVLEKLLGPGVQLSEVAFETVHPHAAPDHQRLCRLVLLHGFDTAPSLEERFYALLRYGSLGPAAQAQAPVHPQGLRSIFVPAADLNALLGLQPRLTYSPER